MKRRIFTTMLLVLLACGQAFSQEVTLEQCIDLALTHNSGLKSNEMDTVAAREESNMALKDFFPSLRLLGNYSVLDKSPRLIVNRNAFATGAPSTDTELPLGDKDFYSLALTIKQPLFTGGVLTHNYRKTLEMSEENRLNYEKQRKQLVFEVKKAFFEALNEKLSAEAMEKALQAKSERLRVLKELFTEGYVSKDEVLRQETDILFTELELMKSRNREGTSRTRLENLVHHTGNNELSLKGNFFNGVLIPSLQEVREAAATHREEVFSGKARIRRAQEEVAIAKGAFFPQVSVAGTYLQQKETSITRPQVWMLTATIDWSIFEWGKTLSSVRRASAQKQREEYQLDEVAREVSLEAELAWRMAKEAEKAVAAHESNVRTNQYYLDRDLKRYAEGKVKLADLLETESVFFKANNLYLASVNALDTEFARLEAAASRPIEDWIVPQPVYRPDFDAITRQISALKQNRKGIVLPAPAVSIPAVTGQTVKVQKQPDPAPSAKIETSAAPSSVAIQVGSFIILKNAQQIRKSILKNSGEYEVSIIPVGKFYKVRITGFQDITAAEKQAQRMGLSNYLIVKVPHGR